MITYLKMKRNEWKVKAQFYGMIAQLIDNPKDVIAILEKLFASLPDVSTPDDVQTNEENE